MNKAIVIGHDAVNALGLVQSLGREGVDGFLYYFKDDKAPFFYQFANKILRKFHLL